VKEFDTICIEDLNVSGMLKNHKLAKSIAEASFTKFFEMLKYKCEWHNKILVKIPRFKPSSKTCSNCGNVKKELKLSERIYNCEVCKHIEDRDLNASKNIEAIGVKIAKRA
jgi:putative transposase